MYSYGVVVWELLTGRVPWENLNPMQVSAGPTTSCGDGTLKNIDHPLQLHEAVKHHDINKHDVAGFNIRVAFVHSLTLCFAWSTLAGGGSGWVQPQEPASTHHR